MAGLQNIGMPCLDNGQPAQYVQIWNTSYVSSNTVNKLRLWAHLPCSLVCLLHNSNIAYYFLHSPSNLLQSETNSKSLHLGRGQGFCENIGHHVLSRTVHEAHMALLDDPLDEVVLHIDVLHARVILVVLGESYGRLIVTEDVHW